MKHCAICLLSMFVVSMVEAEPLTYWTADGKVHTLDVTAYATPLLTVPAEAVAVDLRAIGTPVPDYVLDCGQANPNCLYYVSAEGALTGLPDQNVVLDGHAETLLLQDGNDFYCPEPFKADYAMFIMKPHCDTDEAPVAERPYVDTVVLPFAIDGATPQGINAATAQGQVGLAMLAGYDNSIERLIFSSVSTAYGQPYTPYLVTLPAASYDGKILFWGMGKRVEKTRQAVAEVGRIRFVGTTTAAVDTTGCLRLCTGNEQCFSRAGSGEPLEAFRCYIDIVETEGGELPSASFGDVYFELVVEEVTGLRPALLSASVSQVVSLSGRRWTAPRAGLQIVYGGGLPPRKVIVKR